MFEPLGWILVRVLAAVEATRAAEAEVPVFWCPAVRRATSVGHTRKGVWRAVNPASHDDHRVEVRLTG